MSALTDECFWHTVGTQLLCLPPHTENPCCHSGPSVGSQLPSAVFFSLLVHLGLCLPCPFSPSVSLSPQVSVNGKRLDLTYSFLGSQGIGQCYDSSPCERQPCQHGATCMPAGEYEFQCLCRDGFKGGKACPGHRRGGAQVVSNTSSPCPPTHSPLPWSAGDLCEHEENPCQLREPCLHGGTCQGTRCLCLPGFSGPRCQQGTQAWLLSTSSLSWGPGAQHSTHGCLCPPAGPCPSP